MMPDMARVAALMREVAAAEILPRFRNLAAHDIREKAAGSVVTTADLAAEARLVNGLAAIVPEATVVAEEMAEENPAGIMARLREAAPVWIIDPVDGTANFADGKPPFCVIVAYVERGVTRAGWILDVVADELVSAEEGSGAFRNGTRMKAASATTPGRMTGYLGERLRRIPVLANELGPFRVTRCAGRDHMDLSSGGLHYALFRRTWPWDHAAGALIHREAGGYNAAWDGTPYSAAGSREQGLLLAPDAEGWHALRGLLDAHVRG
jgi:fructose-1,6-bisphosphatase/inositol monophosphatase family enzyme